MTGKQEAALFQYGALRSFLEISTDFMGDLNIVTVQARNFRTKALIAICWTSAGFGSYIAHVSKLNLKT